jgi:hypothetical protein
MNQHQTATAIVFSRRGFLRTSLMGAAFLGTASLGATLSGCATEPMASREVDGKRVSYLFLSKDDRTLLNALVPAILAGALPEDPQRRAENMAATVVAIDEAIYRFGPANQAELRKLFDLLNFGPTRVLTTGIWRSWDSVNPAQAEAFLQRWHSSDIGLFNNAYNGLVKVTNVAYYGRPANWERSNYPGPPAYALAALPQFQQS